MNAMIVGRAIAGFGVCIVPKITSPIPLLMADAQYRELECMSVP